ncbi:MAG TPA: helix-turn-helix domain-containing protein [Syntrophales bacterium]|nr:helix-turn-helix domain-containing protein [Syntrophales bacterium]
MSIQEDDTKQDGLKSLIETYERDLITDALKITFGNQSRAAKLLGTSKRVINYKVHKYAINLMHFRLTRLKTGKDVQKSIHTNGKENNNYVYKIP